jgi:hypothetical protein
MEEPAESALRFNEFRIGQRIEREPRSGVIPSREAGRAFRDVMTGDATSSRIRYPS